MSTSINNGFILTETNFFNIQEKIHSFLPYIVAENEKRIATELANFIQEKIDNLVLKDNKTTELSTQPLINQARSHIGNQQRKLSKDKSLLEGIDCGFQIALFPFKDKTLGITFGQNWQIYKDFIHHIGAKEYYYYNNSDGPKSVSKKAWQTRAKDWDIAFKKSWSTDKVSFIIKLSDAYEPSIIPTAEKICETQPDVCKRIHNFSQDLLYKIYLKDNNIQVDHINLMNVYHSFRKWSESEEAKKITNTHTVQIYSKIILLDEAIIQLNDQEIIDLAAANVVKNKPKSVKSTL